MNRGNEEMHRLDLGPDVIRRLLPYRRPLLLVDRVRAYNRGAKNGRPALWTRRQISSNEEIFAGHFPGLHLWPGIYTQEGLGQSCFLLEVLVGMQTEWERQGGDAEEFQKELANLEAGYQLSSRFRADGSAKLARLTQNDRIGVSASVEMRFTQPVFGGQCLDYHVVRTHIVDAFHRFEVEANVEGRAVARGVMTAALGPQIPNATTPDR